MSAKDSQRSHDHVEDKMAKDTHRVIEAAYRRGAHQCLFMALEAAMEKPTLEGRLAFLCHLSNILSDMRFSRKAYPTFMHEALAKARKK